MQTFETSTTVNDQGKILVAGVPFTPGTEVEVMISAKRSSAEEFGSAWRRLCSELRGRPGLHDVTEAEISHEIDRHRAGQ